MDILHQNTSNAEVFEKLKITLPDENVRHTKHNEVVLNSATVLSDEKIDLKKPKEKK